MKIIFLLNRYTIPLVLAFAIYGTPFPFSPPPTDTPTSLGYGGAAKFLSHYSCTVWVSTDSSIQLAFFATLHWVVAMRAWALWSRSILMGLVIWGGFILYLASAAFLLAKAMIGLDRQLFCMCYVGVFLLTRYYSRPRPVCERLLRYHTRIPRTSLLSPTPPLAHT